MANKKHKVFIKSFDGKDITRFEFDYKEEADAFKSAMDLIYLLLREHKEKEKNSDSAKERSFKASVMTTLEFQVLNDVGGLEIRRMLGVDVCNVFSKDNIVIVY